MCGRYSLTSRPEDLARAMAVRPPTAEGTRRFNVCPTEDVLVVRHDGRPQLQRWGLVPHWARDAGGRPLINARAETMATRRAFRDLVGDARHRCLVLADGFYEWLRAEDGGQPRVPLHFSLPGREPFAFAGLCTRRGDLRSCTIVTTAPSADVARVHDRMPVMLTDDGARAAWLDAEVEPADVVGMCAPLPDGRLQARRVSSAVNRAGYDAPDCLDPA